MLPSLFVSGGVEPIIVLTPSSHIKFSGCTRRRLNRTMRCTYVRYTKCFDRLVTRINVLKDINSEHDPLSFVSRLKSFSVRPNTILQFENDISTEWKQKHDGLLSTDFMGFTGFLRHFVKQFLSVSGRNWSEELSEKSRLVETQITSCRNEVSRWMCLPPGDTGVLFVFTLCLLDASLGASLLLYSVLTRRSLGALQCSSSLLCAHSTLGALNHCRRRGPLLSGVPSHKTQVDDQWRMTQRREDRQKGHVSYAASCDLER